MRFKNNIGPQVRRLRDARGWTQDALTAKLQILGLDITRAGLSKIEARLVFVDDKTMLFLAEALRVIAPVLVGHCIVVSAVDSRFVPKTLAAVPPKISNGFSHGAGSLQV